MLYRQVYGTAAYVEGHRAQVSRQMEVIPPVHMNFIICLYLAIAGGNGRQGAGDRRKGGGAAEASKEEAHILLIDSKRLYLVVLSTFWLVVIPGFRCSTASAKLG